MGETDRYTLLRDALGASDAEKWITRAAEILKAAKKRTVLAESEVAQANTELSAVLRRLDELRASLVPDEAVSQAAKRLRAFAGVDVTADQLVGPTRERIAKVRSAISDILRLIDEWPKALEERAREAQLQEAIQVAKRRVLETTAAVALLPATDNSAALLSEATSVSRDLVTLVHVGKHLGLHDGRCPLCAKGQSAEEFSAGLAAAEERARLLDENAAKIVQQQEARAQAEANLADSSKALAQTKSLLHASRKIIESFDERRATLGLSSDVTLDNLSSRLTTLRTTVEAAEVDLRVIETLRLNQQLMTAKQNEAITKDRVKKAQERFGRARKVEVTASALHDAARRAAAETLDRRLERVLPLMAELYRRLRPHPVWSDIEYYIRGDVRRFLKLQVGDGLNPQFMFSSGQRRATGLAFLLSVNLSLTWSRWKTVLLDDPVQHIDDFRSVQLAEVLAQLLENDRQIICAVEDSALADLLGRRLPVRKAGSGKRVTLGGDTAGALSIREERTLQPLVSRALVTREHLAAS